MTTTARRSRAGAGAAVAVAALAAHAAPARADGLPLPVENSPSGVLAPAGDRRFISVTLGDRTAVLAQKPATGAVTSRANLRGSFTVPLVAYDSTAGGISGDGRTLVLIKPRKAFPRSQTTFAVLTAKPRLRLRGLVRLPGDFSFDALSLDGHSLFLINYLSRTDPTQYRVRVYDLARNRLDPRPIVDPREAPGAMNGFPVTRVSSRDGRWAYTLYDGAGRHPFIHALDTRDRKAACIDLDGPAFANKFAFDLRLAVVAGGRRLDVRRKGAPVASVDTANLRVGPPADGTQRPGTAAPRADPTGHDLLWPALAAALLAAAAIAVRGVRRRRVRADPLTVR
jgi:hypothetical protein